LGKLPKRRNLVSVNKNLQMSDTTRVQFVVWINNYCLKGPVHPQYDANYHTIFAGMR